MVRDAEVEMGGVPDVEDELLRERFIEPIERLQPPDIFGSLLVADVEGLPGVACMMRNVNAAIAKMVGMNQKIRFWRNLSMRGEASSREFSPIAGATTAKRPGNLAPSVFSGCRSAPASQSVDAT